jgi:hypothetical protein
MKDRLRYFDRIGVSLRGHFKMTVKLGNDEEEGVALTVSRFPGAAQHAAKRNGAPQTRDRHMRRSF